MRAPSLRAPVPSLTLPSGRGCAAQVYTGSIDNSIKVWDLRKEALLSTHKGHTDSVTGIALSPDGSHLLSNAMDNTLRVWDMRPYAPSANRCARGSRLLAASVTVLQAPINDIYWNDIFTGWSYQEVGYYLEL